jgi:hypothetical protein
MRVRDWQEILDEVVESDAEPGGWRGVGGRRDGGIGEDLFLAHPNRGVFQLKTYAKNPYEVQGVGSQVARRVDEDLDPLFPEQADGRFAVQQPPEDEDEAEDSMRRLQTVLETHADAPTTPDALLDDVFDALDSPAHGPMDYDGYGRPEEMADLTDTFDEAEDVLEKEFDDVIEEDVERGFY